MRLAINKCSFACISFQRMLNNFVLSQSLDFFQERYGVIV